MMPENYETHVTRLWFDNDPDLYEALQVNLESEPTAYALAQTLKVAVELAAENAGLTNGLVTDLFNGALSDVDFQALAEDYIAEWEREHK
jgi:hypothetical protein